MSGQAVIAIEVCNVLLGIFLNALLLYLIAKYSHPRLGNYRTLLKIFACYDIYMALLHAVVQPASYSSGSALGVFSRRFPEEKHVTALCAGCMTAAFTLMNISFLHRFWSVRRTHRVALFSKPRFLFVGSLYPITMGFLWYCASISLANNSEGKAILQRTLDEVTVGDGWLIIHFWDWKEELHVRGLVTLICGGLIIDTNLSIGGILFALTIHHLRTDHVVSSNNRSYQFKILRALVVQSAIPILFIYIPAGLGVSLPLFITGERKGGLYLWFTCISSFPALDAIVIILLMRDYRGGLLAMVLRKERVVLTNSNRSTPQYT